MSFKIHHLPLLKLPKTEIEGASRGFSFFSAHKFSFVETPWQIRVVSDSNSLIGGADRILENEKSSALEKFCKSGLARLGLELSHETNVLSIWVEALPFCVCSVVL